MKVNPQSFFNFCANHATLLRGLADCSGEISEADARRLIQANPSSVEELPETAWRRLCELQILIPTEPGSEVFLMADPVARLLTYLFNEANPATPEMIRGYVLSLETTGKRLARALDEENVQQVKLAFEEVGLALRRIHADLNETQHAILAEVARYKTERSRVTVREKYRRIVHWMERYVEPMIDIVRADGPLRAAFDETERLLQRAREDALFNDHPALARNLRFLRLVGVHALRVFTQCRKEIQPLYESLRRSSFIAGGAARALEKLQAEGLSKWGNEQLIGISVWRFQNVPGDAAISLALRRVIEHPPEPPPVLEFAAEREESGEKVTMPIHRDLLAHLNKLAGTDKPEVFVMPNTANLKSGGRKGLSETFKRIMRNAGLDAGQVKKAGVRQLSRRTFHALRHSFNSAMANAGVSQEVRMKLTGHKTESVNRGYTHHELEPLRAAVKKIPSLG